MIVILNMCEKDHGLALKLLHWMKELGGCQGHDIIIQSNIIAASNGLTSELEEVAKGIFTKASVRVTETMDERGWPYSCNAAWLDMVFFIKKFVKAPWLWLESDCVPLSTGWLDRIAAAYDAAVKENKPFMGGEITRPQHRMSGIGVYPAWPGAFTNGLPYLPNNKAPWDQVLADDLRKHVQFSPLIQNVWNKVIGDPTTAPTFPDMESLELIRTDAVLFHRCKDGTAIDRLRERTTLNTIDEIVTKESERIHNRLEELKLRIPENPVEIELKAQDEAESLRRRVADLEMQLYGPMPATRPVKPNRRKKQRTPEEQAKINARMAKVRAGRAKV